MPSPHKKVETDQLKYFEDNTQIIYKKGFGDPVGKPSHQFFEKRIAGKPLWTVSDVSEFLQVGEATVRDWVYRKAIPFRKVGRCLRFSPEEIEQWTLPGKG